ncbi:MAG: non-heme iron oxygenase ferredoxin subunit [Omnitrophica bacterium RIFCSPHIGHO2_02_FULL_46_11]|nr:MAG: non-heme iron oxygenase ferredoxin subunit [Omnitrophica bacterium RIFCSPHIGHO2_02_FULL_46_11]OGW88017.1 MAG: non-heme iron oxygenase ferredoxin subunit [Omnitrophica bacterium RIFCSPLOWO2_01_FULL_45_10b]
MSEFTKVAAKSEIAPGYTKKVEINGKEIAVFNIGGNFCAIADTCSHRGGPLSEGSVENNVVTCPWHGWEYDVTNGSCLTNPSVTQAKYDVKVDGGDIYVSA